MSNTIDASDLLIESLTRHQIQLSLLVADTGLWASPEFHRRIMSDTGSAAMFPTVRRARTSQGERRGDISSDGVRFDDNSYANIAIKRATGIGKMAKGFEACHIWPLTCYDGRYHTAIANIVLLPRSLASLSDHLEEVKMVLQYRAFELYGWFPQEVTQPRKPDFYPSSWRPPQPYPTRVGQPLRRQSQEDRKDSVVIGKQQKIHDRLISWASKPATNVHKIIAIMTHAGGQMSISDFRKRVAEVTASRNPDGAIASLQTDSGNAYGRVFVKDATGTISFDPSIAEMVRSLTWYA